MSAAVSPAKFVTCICGKVCKGRAGFANHAKTCPQERARSAAFIADLEASAKRAAEYHWAEHPAISEAEFDAIEAASSVIGGICRKLRPETLGYQMCWRLAGHDEAHISQDGRAWISA